MLADMGYLVFEVVHGPSLILLGKAELANLEQLSAKNPIHGYVLWWQPFYCVAHLEFESVVTA